jgi:hypothetical protein
MTQKQVAFACSMLSKLLDKMQEEVLQGQTAQNSAF